MGSLRKVLGPVIPLGVTCPSAQASLPVGALAVPDLGFCPSLLAAPTAAPGGSPGASLLKGNRGLRSSKVSD